MALTDTECKKAQPKDKQYRLSDLNGLSLKIDPNGNKYWTIRFTVNGQRKSKALGQYPELGLKKAREMANELKYKFSPLNEIEELKPIFREVAEDWFNNQKETWSHIDESLTKYLLESGDMLIGMDGSKVGKNRTRVRESDLPCLLVQRVARLSKKNTICSNFIFLVINSQYFRDYVDVVKTGSAIPHISGGQIKELKLILPSDEKDPIFNKFEQLASSLIDRTDACVDNSLNLSKLRDILLPKLMSGEILIPDAAALVEDA